MSAMFEGSPLTARTVRVDGVPPGDAWLSSREVAAQPGRRVARRAAEWRAGRWAAKLAVARRLDADPSEVEILAAPSGAPEAWTRERHLPVDVSISHRDGRAVAVAAPAATGLGCDVEVIEPRPAGFAEDWFTARELGAVERAAPSDRDELVTLTWSAKESALKAVGAGLRIDTRRVEISFGSDGFEGDVDGKRIRGWWIRDGRFVITAAALEKTR